jgi:hypothetical protein
LSLRRNALQRAGPASRAHLHSHQKRSFAIGLCTLDR